MRFDGIVVTGSEQEGSPETAGRLGSSAIQGSDPSATVDLFGGRKVQGPGGRLELFVPACAQRQLHSCSSCAHVYIQSSVRNHQDGLRVRMSPQRKRRRELIYGGETSHFVSKTKTKQTNGRWQSSTGRSVSSLKQTGAQNMSKMMRGKTSGFHVEGRIKTFLSQTFSRWLPVRVNGWVKHPHR